MADSDVETEYELESFTIGGFDFNITTIAFLPIELLMANRAKQTEISGQKLWCGSLGVIQYLMNNPNIVDQNVVVELGAGTGVLGMICKKLGATNVLLTDHDAISIKHMKDDCARNEIEATVKHLDWYKSETVAEWSLEELIHRADAESRKLVVVAGDVLYKDLLLEPFFATVLKLFSLFPGSKLILCHIPRAGVDHTQVQAKAESLQLTVTEIATDLWREGDCFQYCDPDDLCRARLFEICS
jgi:hypothetical protein